MKPAPFVYRRAESVGEAVELVASAQGLAKYLAGGQTLGPMINLRMSQPDLVVDISRLPELRRASDENGALVVGAATPHAAFEDGTVADPANGLMRRVASGIAYRTVRNRGTIGGSLAHADPSAEWPSVALALGARLRVRGKGGARAIAIEDFLQGPMTTALAEDEIIEAVEIPCLSKRATWGFHKRARKAGEFAYALAVAVADRERSCFRAVLGATGTAPLVLARVSAHLAQSTGWSAGQEAEVAKAYAADIEAAALALDGYARHVHRVAVTHSVKEALAR
jgi:carbon-monoxide dehydrogenase medium subunit